MPTSRLGLGLAALGRPAYITAGRSADLGAERTVEAMRELSWQVLDRAYDAGIRYVDVARSYGRGEEFVAGWLAANPRRADVTVGSKWGYRYVGDWRGDAEVHEVKDHSPAAFTRQLAETRALLGDRLAVYHVHSATVDTGVLEDDELHRALAALRDSGVRVGVSTSGPEQAAAVRRALAVTVDRRPLFTSIQSTWNLLETSVAGALAEAAAAGARVIVKEAVANGRLTSAEQPDDERVRRAAAIAAELGLGVDQLAMAAALAQPWVWRVLSGAVTTGQLDSNAAAERVRLPPGVLDELATLAQPPTEYWTARSHRPWA
jgi:aryl-alcohol dehydrogenase-like predicted oxidoreductase